MYLDGLIGRIYRVSRVVGPVTHSVDATDTARLLVCNTAGGAVTVVLPASPTIGVFLNIKDSSGNSSTNNITVSGNGKTIDGAATFVISVDRANLTIVYTGTGWVII